jgi:hypothetical protein
MKHSNLCFNAYRRNSTGNAWFDFLVLAPESVYVDRNLYRQPLIVFMDFFVIRHNGLKYIC